MSVAAIAGLVALALGAVAPSTLTAQTERAGDPLPGLDLHMPVPVGAPTGPEAVALGRLLFFERTLSRDSTVSCASCHRPGQAFADDRRVSVGVFGRRGTRNVPTILNRGWGKSFFWDGRIETLETQVLQPILAPAEMDMSLEEVVARLAADPSYQKRFHDVFGEEVDAETLAAALTAYVRSIQAGDSRFDREMEGESVLNDVERHGLELFQGRARCARCHSGALLTDEVFHNTGVAWRSGAPADSGRALVTGRHEDIGAFKTPTLRQIEHTAPYMHDGSLATLEEVVDFYSDGGHANPYLDPLIRPLGLDEDEKAALVAFLKALGGRIVEGTP